MAIFFAFLAFFGWGVGDIFGAISSRRLGYKYSFFWSLVFSTIFGAILLPFAGKFPSISDLLLAACINLIDFMGTILYFRALEIGNISLVATIAASDSFVTVVLSALIFKEIISPTSLVGLIFVFIGILLASIKLEDLRKMKKGHMFIQKGVILALITWLLWGTYYALLHIPVAKIGWFWARYPWDLFFVFFILMGKVKKDAFHIFKDKRGFQSVILFSILTSIAVFAFNLGITTQKTSIIAPIAGSFPVLMVLLTRIVFKEPLTRQQKVGITSSLVGIVLLAFASS